MKIQFLNGGLANQVFQYIFARYYELSHPGEIMYLDDSYFALNTVHNGYELEKVFGLHPHMLSECFDEEVWSYMLEERKKGKSIPQILTDNEIPFCMISEMDDAFRTFNPFDGKVVSIPSNEYFPEILDYPDDIYYHGYWINKKWFESYRDIFLKEFTFPQITDEKNQGIRNQILSSKSVAFHVRRGDYVSLGWDMDAQDYKKMVTSYLSVAGNDWTVFVFSDDIAWCKENATKMGLNQFEAIVYVEGNNGGRNYIDMQLMSRCKGMIMSRSAFCYLAALLNTQRQIVINPTEREV